MCLHVDIKVQKWEILPFRVQKFLYIQSTPVWQSWLWKAKQYRKTLNKTNKKDAGVFCSSGSGVYRWADVSAKTKLSKYIRTVMMSTQVESDLRNLMSAFPQACWWSERRTGCGPKGYRWQQVDVVQVQARVAALTPAGTQWHRFTAPDHYLRGLRFEKMDM